MTGLAAVPALHPAHSPKPSQPARRRAAFAVLVSLTALLGGCATENVAESAPPEVPTAAALVAAAESGGMVRVAFPAENPGIPAYARLGLPSAQLFHDASWLVVPFYRNPEMIRGDFNLLSLFDFSGPDGPGAFGVPLTVSGFYMIERDAAPTDFPRVVVTRGTDVPVWFVSWPAFDAAGADGVVSMDDLRAMNPVQGVASTLEETLRPRVDEHLVVLDAKGRTTDGRAFSVHVTHVGATTKALRITLR